MARGLFRQAGAPPVDRARRMRVVATCLLLAMAVIYAVTRRYEGLHPALGFVRAFAEK